MSSQNFFFSSFLNLEDKITPFVCFCTQHHQRRYLMMYRILIIDFRSIGRPGWDHRWQLEQPFLSFRKLVPIRCLGSDWLLVWIIKRLTKTYYRCASAVRVDSTNVPSLTTSLLWLNVKFLLK